MKDKIFDTIKKHAEICKFACLLLCGILGGVLCYFIFTALLNLQSGISALLSATIAAAFVVIAWIFRNLIIKLIIKYQEIVKYGIFGVLTTLVNYGFYIFFTRLFHMHELWSTGVAFMLSIIFAYFTNRIWVFESKVKGKGQIAEFSKFFLARSSGFFIDLGIMWLFVTKLAYNDLVVKILSNVFIIVMNFVISKVFVFKNK